ncbi:MAG: hypothetical protein RR367_06490 [Clostridia bacterium]
MTGLSQKQSRLMVALFFLALALIGLLATAPYGIPCDELSEQVILRENMKEYAYRFLGEQSEAVRYYDRLGVQRISQSIERDHGQCAYYPIASLLPLAESAPDLLSLLWHGYTWLWFMAGVLALYGLCRETGLSRPLACAGALLLYLCPRFFAEGHYNNKDILLLSLSLLTLWAGARFLRQITVGRGLLFSFFGAMATNTKIVGAFVWGVIGLCAIVLLTARREWSRRVVGVAACTLGGYAACYALLTPALWGDAPGYLHYLLLNASGFTRWPGVVLFRGMLFDHAVNPLPRYYLPYMMLVTLPLYVPLLAIAGQLSAIRRWMLARSRALGDPAALILLAATLCWLIPLGFAMLTRTLVYNGWRHFYFIYAGVALLSAHGTQALACALKRLKRPLWRRLGAGALCLCFTLSAVGIALNQPYQYGYYNALARKGAQTDMELDYWNVSTQNAMRALLTAQRNQSLPLVLGAREDMSWLGIKYAHSVMRADERQALAILESADAPYLFSNTTYAKIYGVPAPEGYRELLRVESYGNVLCVIYEKAPSNCALLDKVVY